MVWVWPGIVYKGSCFGKPAAIKVIEFATASKADDFKREVGIVASLHHPNIVFCPGASMDNEEGSMVLELLSINLNKAIHFPPDKGGLSFDTAQKDAILLGVASGMMYLHAPFDTRYPVRA